MLNWQRDVLPVIRATYALMEERGEDVLDGDDLGPELSDDPSDPELYRIFRLIDQSGYAKVSFAGGMTIAFVQPTEKGLQLTHGWPVPGEGEVEALLRLIDVVIEAPDTPEDERTRLQQLRQAAGNVSQSVLSGLLSAWLSQVAGLGGG